MGDPDIVSWCPHNQSCKGNLCNLWDQYEAECFYRIKIMLEIKMLKLREKTLILQLRKGRK